jgi:Spy/CpxP family protein refolding chaperone
MSPFWRNLIVTVLVAAAAGAAGGWVGAERAGGRLVDNQPLRESVDAIITNGLDLTADQKKQIAEIEDHYYQKRGLLRNQIAEANMELADALMTDMSFGREAQNAVTHVQQGLGELQKATILYVLEVRDVLTPEQQKAYDRKVREALVAPEP